MAEPFMGKTRLPLRFFLSAGRYETIDDGAHGIPDIRQFRDALAKQGYDLSYQEIEGQHDWLNWRFTLPEGLQKLAPAKPEKLGK